jgi:hypothetical protein
MEPISHVLSIPIVVVEHFWVNLNEKHVFAYFQCRSSTYMSCVRDLDLESMINLSNKGQQDLTKLNTKKAAYVESLYHERTYMTLVEICHH